MLSTGFWLHHAALAWRAELDGRLAPVALTPTQFIILATVGWLQNTGGAPTQRSIAESAGTDKMMTSKVLRSLESRDLVVRVSDDSDARAVRVSLTDKGTAVARQATRTARDLDREMFAHRPPDLRSTLRGIVETAQAAPPGTP